MIPVLDGDKRKTEHQSNKKASSRKWHKKVADPAIKKHAITWRLWTHIETAEVKKRYSTGQRTTTKKRNKSKKVQMMTNTKNEHEQHKLRQSCSRT